MKTGKKIAVLFVVFIAAAIIYFIGPVGRHGDQSGVIAYTAMGEATLPVVYPQMLGREMAPLFGHAEEKAVTAERGSLILLPEDRRLCLRVAEAEQVTALRYEIRTMDLENLVERTELSGWQETDGEIVAELPIQNLLKSGTEYMLGFETELSDGRSVWYYTRILQTDNAHVDEMLALAEEFSVKTLDYNEAQALTMYMESAADSDNSTFGTVTLKNSFTQLTWGDLDVRREGEVFPELKELSGDLATIELNYSVVRDGEEGEERYAVREVFTMRWTTQRIYMMDFERTMDEAFAGDRSAWSGRRILLGIRNGEGLTAVKSAGGRYTAFTAGRELWIYNSGENTGICAFSFGGAGADDVRYRHDGHEVEILDVAENGDVDFIVYGYMNRGRHEGWTGVSYYHYSMEDNTLEELFFLPATESFEELQADVRQLAHKGGNGVFYLLMDHAVYGVDITSREYIVAASGLTEGKYAVSSDGSRLAWQENTGMYDSRLLYVMDLDTGTTIQLGDGRSGVYRILGFVGSDCIYGSGEYGDYVMSNGRIMGIYLSSIDIVDRNMENAMHYENAGRYIRDVSVDDSRIHIRWVRNREAGFFGEAEEDTLVCNAETLPGKTDDIGWYASDEKERIYFVQLSSDIASGQTVRMVSPRLVASEETVISVNAALSPVSGEFYAYGRGRLLGRFISFAEAAEAAYDSMGFVSAGKNQPVWVRANRASSYYIRDLETAERKLERCLEGSQTEYLLVDGSGSTLNQVLYFVGNNVPVLLYTGEGSRLYLTGYDQSHVRVYHPETGTSETLEMEAAEAYFASLGNDYLCCAQLAGE